MSRIALAALFVILMQLAGTAVEAASAYKWRDTNGKLYFSDKPPVQHKAEYIDIKVTAPSVDAAPLYQSSGEKQSEPKIVSPDKLNKKVVMYSTSWCPVCKTAKQFFQQNGVDFVEKDIEKSTSAEQEYKRLGGNGVPLIVVGDNTMSGFSEGHMRSLLGL